MKTINIAPSDLSLIAFNNNVDYCIGTGRLGLALTSEYYKQLKYVQEEIGFSYIRGHGLLSDDIGIYQEYEENGNICVEYNFTYLDRIFDDYASLGIKPFIELGFMPEKLGSGRQTIFYWKGNVTPPKDYDKWDNLIRALFNHLIGRYGIDEILTWPVEVWNEPNLPGFWENADKEEYFKLFRHTYNVIKSINPKIKVGGPAICGVQDEIWMKAFLDYCKKEMLQPDFISRHHYTIEFPEINGHYAYSRLLDAEEGFANLKTTRDITDSYEEFRDLPIHITEFNTSYTPQGVIHDTNLNAALLARQLSRLGDVNESYSYWTFGDVFEEKGIPFTLFSGGFGLLANNCIPKPSFWTFAFFKELKKKMNNCLFRNDNILLGQTDNGYAGILWNATTDKVNINLSLPENTTSSEKFENTKCENVKSAQNIYTLITKTVDNNTCNPLKTWHNLGEPASLSNEEISLIKESARPFISTELVISKESIIASTFELEPDAVIFFEIKNYKLTSDRGYDYEKAVNTR